MQTSTNHPAGIVLRRGERSDIAALTRVFYRAVREGAGPEYSTEQRAAWAPAPPEVAAPDSSADSSMDPVWLRVLRRPASETHQF